MSGVASRGYKLEHTGSLITCGDFTIMKTERSLKRNFIRMPLVLSSTAFTLKTEIVSFSAQQFSKANLLRSGTLAQRMDGSGLRSQKQTAIIRPNSNNHRKRVTFQKKITVHDIISRHDILPKERADSWFSDDEFGEIAQSCFIQVQKLNRGERLKDKKYCARGLESETKVGLQSRLMNRRLAQKVVLEEQGRQHREGVREPMYLAYLYHSATSSCQVWANLVGLSDQREAEDVMETMFTVKDNHTSISPCDRPSAKDSLATSVLNRNIELARAA